MKDRDLSKCQCERAGFCPVFNMEMGISPPNFSWCQSATEEQREKFLKNTSKTVRKVKERENFVPVVNFYDQLPEKKSRFAVCVIPANESAMKLLDVSRDSIKSYAEKCGADYIELTGNQCEDWPIGNKFRLYHVTSVYEKTVFLDCDVIVKDNAPNLFKITPDDKISAYDEYHDWPDRKWIINQYQTINKAFGRPFDLNIPNFMINSGVLVIPNSCREYYKQPSEPYPKIWCFDQQYLSMCLPDNKFFRLDRRWNNCLATSGFWEGLEASYIQHVNGEKKQKARRNLLQQLVNGAKSEYEIISEGWNLPKSYTLPDNMDEVEIVTIHYNAIQSKRLTKTYKLWMKSLKNVAPFVKCYEIVFDGREPEIPNSIVIPASLDKNCLWQKESLLNLAFKNIDKNKKYFFWIDHDACFQSPKWLEYALDKMENGFDFVQLFDMIAWSDKYGNTEMIKKGRVWSLGNQSAKIPSQFDGVQINPHVGNPGMAWAARVDSLKKIGESPWPNAVIGSGDEYFCMGIIRQLDIQRIMSKFIGGTKHRPLKQYGKTYSKKMLDTIDKIAGLYFNSTYCPWPVFHIWHGDSKNRQYVTRHDIITDCELDLDNDIYINEDGIFEFVEDKRHASKRFYKFFLDRKED